MKNIPNILSVFRIFAAIACLVCMMVIAPENRVLYILVCGIIFGLGCISDYLDGKIARKYNLISDFGKFVDPIADKLLTFFAMLGFVYAGADKGFPFMIIAIAVTLFREFIVSSVRMVSASKGTVVAANIYGKLKTVFQMAALIAYFIFIETSLIVIAQGLLCIAVVMTLISGLTYVGGFFKMMKGN